MTPREAMGTKRKDRGALPVQVEASFASEGQPSMAKSMLSGAVPLSRVSDVSHGERSMAPSAAVVSDERHAARRISITRWGRMARSAGLGSPDRSGEIRGKASGFK